MNTIEIVNVDTPTVVVKKRGRPTGSKNSVSVKEHNDRMTLRKENLKISFQKYKAEHQEELRATYKTLYNKNKERKLKRMKVLHTARSFVNQLMKLDGSIMV